MTLGESVETGRRDAHLLPGCASCPGVADLDQRPPVRRVGTGNTSPHESGEGVGGPGAFGGVGAHQGLTQFPHEASQTEGASTLCRDAWLTRLGTRSDDIEIGRWLQVLTADRGDRHLVPSAR